MTLAERICQPDIPAITVRTALDSVEICFAGDTYFGELLQGLREARGEKNYLKVHGYSYGFEQLREFLQGMDVVIANLETALTKPGQRSLLVLKMTHH